VDSWSARTKAGRAVLSSVVIGIPVSNRFIPHNVCKVPVTTPVVPERMTFGQLRSVQIGHLGESALGQAVGGGEYHRDISHIRVVSHSLGLLAIYPRI
jgi:hypothetical protein